MLGVHSKSTNLAIYLECGTYPIYIKMIKQIFKFWFRNEKTKKDLLIEALKEDKILFIKDLLK
jgi:hypothetical protein